MRQLYATEAFLYSQRPLLRTKLTTTALLRDFALDDAIARIISRTNDILNGEKYCLKILHAYPIPTSSWVFTKL